MQSLATPRLRLIPLSISDAPAIQRTFPKWEIVRWMDGAVPWPYPQDGAEGYLKHVALPEIEAGRRRICWPPRCRFNRRRSSWNLRQP